MKKTKTTTQTAARTILALDLGKYKSVACAYDPDTAEARFDTLTTSREELRKLFARERPAVVVIEACTLAGWVHDLCAELGLPCEVATPPARPGSSNTPNARPTRTTPSASPNSRPSGNYPPSPYPINPRANGGP